MKHSHVNAFRVYATEVKSKAKLYELRALTQFQESLHAAPFIVMVSEMQHTPRMRCVPNH